MLGKSIQSLLFILTVFTSVCSAVDCNSGPLELPDHGILFAKAGDSLLLNCTSTDTPIAWYYNNIPLSTDVRSRQSINSDGDLSFSNLQITQSGWYTCASNPTRVEEDFLLIVGVRPVVVDTGAVYTYSVVPGSRVVLACPTMLSGFPTPDFIWRDGSGRQIFDGGSFSIDPTTGSLSIDNYSQTEVDLGGYTCQLCNEFGSVATIASDITLTDTTNLPFMYTSELDTNPTPMYIAPNRTTNVMLQCIGRSSGFISSNNITFQWSRDYGLLTDETGDRLTLQTNTDGGFDSSTSGYYCCNVNYMEEHLSRHCLDVWVGDSIQVQPTLPPTTITLPAGIGRRLQLGCLSEPLRYNEPVVMWLRNNQTIENSTTTLVYGSSPLSLNYVSISNVSTEGRTTASYTCKLGNSVELREMSFSVTAVDLGTGDNLVMNGEASANEFGWIASNINASQAHVNYEDVFQLVYSGPGTTFNQTVITDTMVTALYVSGRIRQTSVAGPGVHRGVAALKVSADGEIPTYVVNPGSESDAWQWVGQAVKFTQPVDEVTIEMVVQPESGLPASTLSGQAFFDDIRVSVLTAIPPVEFPLVVVIGASVGGGVLIILLLLLILIVCCCCLCPKCKKKSSMMKKMSINMIKRFSTKKYNRRYQNHVALQSIQQTSPIPIYEEPVQDTGDYVNPEDYQYVNTNDSNPRAIPKQSVAGNSDGQYTALDPASIEAQNTYATATPVSHRSLASLQDPDETEDGYVEVTPGYLPVLPPTEMARSVPTSIEPEPEQDLYENDPMRIRNATSPGELDPNVYESIKGPYR